MAEKESHGMTDCGGIKTLYKDYIGDHSDSPDWEGEKDGYPIVDAVKATPSIMKEVTTVDLDGSPEIGSEAIVGSEMTTPKGAKKRLFIDEEK